VRYDAGSMSLSTSSPSVTVSCKRRRPVRNASGGHDVRAMGVGTLLGAALPAVPLLAVGGTAGWVAVVAVSVALAVVVGEVRARMTSSARSRAYGLTLAVLALGAAVGFGAGLA
jgi:VIT1/CCC1 family predicted Fe2+/Mn2+ transporter